ncbi:MAG: SPASM domain-containing protein [Desulfovibrionaceae bacterium]|jgi:MoaA/NifB/PqqE/SkfB family radical SAM enzyme|nr:SPASM domain-containing protein [Desulfovibrionaceae bacterium]
MDIALPTNLTRLLPAITPALDWIQIEPTTHRADPAMAPAFAGYREQWIERHMAPETFARLAPVLSRAKRAHLQGWGEPFLHPDILAFLHAAKGLCAHVSTGTAGAALTERHMHALIGLQIDSVTVAMPSPAAAGAPAAHPGGPDDPTRHARRAVDALRRLRERYGSPLPTIIVLRTVTRGDLGELGGLEALPPAMADLGADRVVLSMQSYATTKELADDAVVPEDEEAYRALRARLEAVAERGAALGLGWHHFLVYGGAPGTACIERPQGAAFVGADGGVGPCVFSRLPVRGAATYHFQGRELEYPACAFGSVDETPFRRIWARPDYRALRRDFEHGRLPGQCRGCWRPYLLPD